MIGNFAQQLLCWFPAQQIAVARGNCEMSSSRSFQASAFYLCVAVVAHDYDERADAMSSFEEGL